MTSVFSPEASAYSTTQRRSHLLLMLCLPEAVVTLDRLCHFNGVNDAVTRQDIAEVALEVQRYHRLVLELDEQGNLLLHGERLNLRLCLLHALRRALRVAPDFVSHHFSQQLRLTLQQRAVSKALYDQRNLQALVLYCSRHLLRDFSARDSQLLQLYLQYAMFHTEPVEFSPQQTAWLAAKQEFILAQSIIRCWQKYGYHPVRAGDASLLALLFSQMHIPLFTRPSGQQELQLMMAVQQLIEQFQHLSNKQVSRQEELSAKLFSHLAQALERAQFGIGIDSSLVEDVAQHYPRLVRTTQAALKDFEQLYAMRFSPEEVGLIAIIFGAWLMHDSVLHEKQVLLLTDTNSDLERLVEQQLRELTLLPLNIKYQAVEDFQRDSAPKGTALVITPYIATLPLFSPPLIHVELPLGKQQQRSIRALLEA